jgi:hypothetical protein
MIATSLGQLKEVGIVVDFCPDTLGLVGVV